MALPQDNAHRGACACGAAPSHIAEMAGSCTVVFGCWCTVQIMRLRLSGHIRKHIQCKWSQYISACVQWEDYSRRQAAGGWRKGAEFPDQLVVHHVGLIERCVRRPAKRIGSCVLSGRQSHAL